MAESLVQRKLNSAKFKDMHNEHEWTPELDNILKKSVINN